jgi:nucleotidyltransferase substrate binding protein (TIGR01987 family)
MAEDIRWKQRFVNFDRAFTRLKDAVSTNNPSELERAGIIQIYEFTFELAWKTLKDFMEDKQIPVQFPKDTIKEGFKYELIDDGDTWMDMLEKRNLMAHTYDEANAMTAYNLIKEKYLKALGQVQEKLMGSL